MNLGESWPIRSRAGHCSALLARGSRKSCYAQRMMPERQIRASYTDTTIRVYQAYPEVIADTALKHGTFVSPPFSMNRMTWIKPSFLWMMYRAGWGFKDDGQRRIL